MEAKDIKQLAIDLVSGKVFTDRHLPTDDVGALHMVFLPLAIMDEKQRKRLAKQEIYLMYEYIDKAGPRSYNGYPIFFSMQTLNKKDTEAVFAYVKKVKEALENV